MNDFSALDVLAFLFFVATHIAGQKEIMKTSKVKYGDGAAIFAFLLIQALAVAACIQLLTN